MRLIKWHLDHHLTGCDLDGTIEVVDDATEEDIEFAVKEDMWNLLSLTWHEVEEGAA